ncbi:PaaI family thioesterase [Roseomonas marmotae]|uniref:PaaI family thioesterase n=1 Tax=Roseomonas marmotae TaxID=2768161 RepID=A0ABS3K972_9PROT|nr:PaaI family thioesterase [Roseomonas marmotae]MBO1074002.1 PaaI family thioesterase [Roseomonas marmotae]QTI78790.1 PaaI family thioesterase [Roseomonas marmotae]
MSENENPDFAAASAPYHDLLGMRLEEWRDGYARVAMEAGEQHMNRSNIVHGGVILSMIDQAAGFSGLWCSVPGNARRAVTIDLDCRFTGQTLAGRVVAEARMVSRGRNIYFVRTEVFNAAGQMVAFGSSTHRWRKGSETVEGVPEQPPQPPQPR